MAPVENPDPAQYRLRFGRGQNSGEKLLAADRHVCYRQILDGANATNSCLISPGRVEAIARLANGSSS
jgi:hypothetical protein